MDKIKTGISGLDLAIKGGFVRGNAIALLGPSGSGKTFLSQTLCINALNAGESIIYICADVYPDDFRSTLSQMSLDVKGFEETGKLKIIDAFSWRIGKVDVKYDISLIDMGSIIPFLNKTIEKMTEKNDTPPAYIVFDSFSSIIDYNSVEAAYKLIQTLKAHNKIWQSILFFHLPTAHQKEQLMKLSYPCDGLITLDISDNNRKFLQIVKLPYTEPNYQRLELTFQDNLCEISGVQRDSLVEKKDEKSVEKQIMEKERRLKDLVSKLKEKRLSRQQKPA